MRAAIEPSPQARTGDRPEFEIAVERQFDGVGSGDDWRCLEPKTMLHTVQFQHGMPTIGCLPKLAFVQPLQSQPDMCLRACKRSRPDGYDRRHGLGSPEDRLFNEGSFGIRCEKPTPNADEIRRLWFGPMMRQSGNLARTTRFGAGTPTQCRSFPLPRRGRSKRRLTISS